MIEIHNPDNYLPQIEDIYMYVTVDEFGEGVIATTVSIHGQLVQMPLLGADKARIDSLKPLAIQAGKESGKSIKLIKFSKRTVLEEINFK